MDIAQNTDLQTNQQTDVQSVGVVGAGTMGGGIATLLLMNGLKVQLFDPAEEALARSRKRIAKRNDEAALEKGSGSPQTANFNLKVVANEEHMQADKVHLLGFRER